MVWNQVKKRYKRNKTFSRKKFGTILVIRVCRKTTNMTTTTNKFKALISVHVRGEKVGETRGRHRFFSEETYTTVYRPDTKMH